DGNNSPFGPVVPGSDQPSSRGRLDSITGAASFWINQISTAGVPGCGRPAFSDISGSLAAGQLPAFGSGVESFASGGRPGSGRAGFWGLSRSLAPGQLPAFASGDVSFASGGGAGTIAAGAVTLAK